MTTYIKPNGSMMSQNDTLDEAELSRKVFNKNAFLGKKHAVFSQNMTFLVSLTINIDV